MSWEPIDPLCPECKGTGKIPTVTGSPLESRPCRRCSALWERAKDLCGQAGTAGQKDVFDLLVEEFTAREALWVAREKWRNLAKRYDCKTPEEFMSYVAELHAAVERLKDIVEYHRSFMSEDQKWQADQGLADAADDEDQS